jgi:hypothetical protein
MELLKTMRYSWEDPDIDDSVDVGDVDNDGNVDDGSDGGGDWD